VKESRQGVELAVFRHVLENLNNASARFRVTPVERDVGDLDFSALNMPFLRT
jgi:hypothetical protein